MMADYREKIRDRMEGLPFGPTSLSSRNSFSFRVSDTASWRNTCESLEEEVKTIVGGLEYPAFGEMEKSLEGFRERYGKEKSSIVILDGNFYEIVQSPSAAELIFQFEKKE